MERSRTALIIPAFNEIATIGGVIDALMPHGLVIVVDDGSSDDTANEAVRHGAEVIRHPRNLGYDAALGSGFARADALGVDFVVTLDADGQHPPELVETFIRTLAGGSDLVLGARSSLPRFSERLSAAITRRMFGVVDPFSGMKGYRIEVYRALGAFDTYGSIGTQLMLHAIRNGAKVATIPLTVRQRADHTRFGTSLGPHLRLLRATALGLVRK